MHKFFKRIFLIVFIALILGGCGGGSSGGSSGGSGGGSGGGNGGGSNNVLRGINYDPAHSQRYLNGQAANSQSGLTQMQATIDNDLKRIAASGFQVVKTYYSEYCNGAGCINIAKEVAANTPELKLALGVFEFSNSRLFTAGQVNAAITAVNTYPQEIVAVIVGNEDINMATDIMTDIGTIKAGITGSVPPIGTAQTNNTWMNPDALPAGFLNSLTFVGTNIYPFFGGENSGSNGAASIPGTLSATVATLKAAGYAGTVAVTEEGWASGGISPGNFPTQANETAYYQGWLARAGTDTFDSYYFSMYDTLYPPVNTNVNNFFGLCGATGTTKDSSMFSCQ